MYLFKVVFLCFFFLQILTTILILVSSGHLHVNVLVYSNLSMALNGEISYKLVLFISLFVCLFVEASCLYLFSFTSGKRASNKRILESTSKENFKVSF